MSLRRKILLSFIALSLFNGFVCLTLIETAYLAGDSFQPGGDVFAPGFAQVAVYIGVGTFLTAGLLFWTIRRLVLDPVDEMVDAAAKLTMDDGRVSLAIKRRDEIGLLAAAFNHMSENIHESRRHLEGKVRDATEKVQETQRNLAFAERLAATGRLAAGVAHEINNPLGGVMNAVARLRRGDLPPERREKYLNICDDGLGRIQKTVRRILDFSRKRPEIAPVKVTEPLLASIELVRHMLESAGIALTVDVDDSSRAPETFRVMADAADLQHVFLNLLVNAVDAMPKGGALAISVTQLFKWVVVEIADTGVGLTIEELSASFDYFHTTKPVGKGTGLGLSIAHHIVAGYGGALTLNSRKGEGTKATVELPMLGYGGVSQRLKARAPGEDAT